MAQGIGWTSSKVILTDQDKTLEEVISEVLPDSRHCFCLWHVLSKIQEKLGHVIRQHERMSTMQQAESVSSLLDECILCKTTLTEFFDQYKKLLQEKSQGEANADFETRHKQPGLKSPSPFEKQMSTLYTHTIFKKFQVDVLGVVACHPKKGNDDGETGTFKVQDFEVNQEFIVVWNERTSDTSCAKSRENMRQVTLVDSRIQRYNDLCQRAFELGDEASLSQESYNIVFSVLENFLRTCETVNDENLNESEPCSLPNQSLNDLEVFIDSNNPSKSNGKNIMQEKRRSLHKYGGNDEKKVLRDNCVFNHANACLKNLYIANFMGQSSFGEPTVDYPFGSHSAIQPMGHIYSRILIPDGYYSSPQMIQGVGQLNTNTQGYANHLNMLVLGQLNTLASIEDGPYLSQPRLHGLGQMYFRPADTQNPFGVQDTMNDAVEEACQSGVSVIEEPGGSLRDKHAVECRNKYGVSLVFTNVRHIRH
ncbi:protein FAR-RED ELONGATED HYPOCOTYL 3-like [Solanum dulcamara]|uniref:protein FAR-RED ELONGATED HYPOCOTYL 3-like n=1 Tax=Solanum dulcamara TaxID=45834 RepID=UPI00248613A4|nr:protein FAR-RED ELONGATED HYPOCOTYL 3-like [Solanum dulcamara]